jgi:hypothetical protein
LLSVGAFPTRPISGIGSMIHSAVGRPVEVRLRQSYRGNQKENNQG